MQSNGHAIATKVGGAIPILGAIDATFSQGRILLLNSSASPLPNPVLGAKIPLPIGLSRCIQRIDIKPSCVAGQAIFERQNRFSAAVREVQCKSARARP